MMNDRPVVDPNLQAGLNEIKAIMLRRGLAGAAMLVSPEEAAFTYGIHAPWSAFRYDPETQLGFRLYANSKKDGEELTRERVGGAAHTVCQLCDFGMQTVVWMNDLKRMLNDAGIEFDHTSFNDRPMPHIYALK